MKKILLIEDSKPVIDIWKRLFDFYLKEEKLILIFAVSLDEAIQKFRLNPDVELIVVDGCIWGSDDRPNTQGLVSEIRKTFKGPMIAESSNEEYRKILLSAGCNYECEKDDVPKKVLRILGLYKE